MIQHLKRWQSNQRGFTLIELLVAMAISAALIAGVNLAFFQIVNGNIHNSSQMVALRQVQNTGYWISQDALQSETIEFGADQGFPLVINYTEWTSTDTQIPHKITYTKIDQSVYREDLLVDDDTSTTTLVAEYISNISFEDTTPLDNPQHKYSLSVTATINSDKPANETRIYEIEQRVD